MCALYYLHFMRGMQRVTTVLLQYCCNVVSLLQPVNHSLWLVIVKYNALFTLHYVRLRYGMLFMQQQYGMQHKISVNGYQNTQPMTVQLTAKFTIALVFSCGTRTRLVIFIRVHKLCMRSRMHMKIFTAHAKGTRI